MNRSAKQMLEDAGLDLGRSAVGTWRTLQIAKIHTDLAFRLEEIGETAVITLADTDGAVTQEFYTGAHRVRAAQGRINRLKRGEQTLTTTTNGDT